MVRCREGKCRVEAEVMFADGTGLCWKHWEKHCEEKI